MPKNQEIHHKTSMREIVSNWIRSPERVCAVRYFRDLPSSALQLSSSCGMSSRNGTQSLHALSAVHCDHLERPLLGSITHESKPYFLAKLDGFEGGRRARGYQKCDLVGEGLCRCFERHVLAVPHPHCIIPRQATVSQAINRIALKPRAQGSHKVAGFKRDQ